jgi:hypothetical protein
MINVESIPWYRFVIFYENDIMRKVRNIMNQVFLVWPVYQELYSIPTFLELNDVNFNQEFEND